MSPIAYALPVSEVTRILGRVEQGDLKAAAELPVNFPSGSRGVVSYSPEPRGQILTWATLGVGLPKVALTPMDLQPRAQVVGIGQGGGEAPQPGGGSPATRYPLALKHLSPLHQV